MGCRTGGQDTTCRTGDVGDMTFGVQDVQGLVHAGPQAGPSTSAGQGPQSRETPSAGEVRGAPDAEEVTLAQALVPLASEDDEEEGGDEDDEDEMILLPEVGNRARMSLHSVADEH